VGSRLLIFLEQPVDPDAHLTPLQIAPGKLPRCDVSMKNLLPHALLKILSPRAREDVPPTRMLFNSQSGVRCAVPQPNKDKKPPGLEQSA
jgi:hypothetical protein